MPAMDNDDMRRGKPTVHKAYDEATAILVGDALQTLAFEITADPQWQADAGIRADLVLGLAKASGLGGMVGGQLLDLAAEGRFGPVSLDVDDTLRMQAMKTGAILAFSVEAGAIVGGASADERAALLRYGVALGQAFQIADDILDREASPEAMGKATGKDKDAGKATLVDRLGLDGARAECDRLVGVCDEAVARWGERRRRCATPPASRWRARPEDFAVRAQTERRRSRDAAPSPYEQGDRIWRQPVSDCARTAPRPLSRAGEGWGEG